MKKISVIVVDDSDFMRSVICDIIKVDSELEVVAEAKPKKTRSTKKD